MGKKASARIVFSPLAQGLLSDRYLKGIPGDSRAARDFFLKKKDIGEDKLAKIRALNEIAARRGQTLAEMAVAWVLRDPRVTSALVGTSKVSQVDDNVAALKNLNFSAEELQPDRRRSVRQVSAIETKKTREKMRFARLDVRCSWPSNDLAILYHDREWGVPQHDDRVLFEFLILEGAQAGLSWDTILHKRENYRAAFDGFDPRKIARYDRERCSSCCKNEGIVRNRLKIASTDPNARHFSPCRKNSEFRPLHVAIRRRPAESATLAPGGSDSRAAPPNPTR